tara:strand:- start:712 stop:1635 length:924 start_codon:yes stop_codon:yes gene_type:complete
MKLIINIIFISLVLAQIPSKSNDIKKKIKKSRLNLNVGGIIPEKMHGDERANSLAPHQIEEIRLRARDYESLDATKDDIVLIKTSKGQMKLRLFPNIAPNHCNNFKKLANSGFYNGTLFHRIIPGFMIQGGDILTRDSKKENDGQGGPGWTIDEEFSDLKHKRGTLSMARSQDRNSAGSQFFICVADTPWLDGKYTIFGEVVEGDYLIDSIVNSPTDYSFTKAKAVSKINPDDPGEWITIGDPKTRKKLYFKVPEGVDRYSFELETKKLLRSDSPIAPIEIISMEVVNKIDMLMDPVITIPNNEKAK